MFGLDETGFTRKRLADIVASLQAKMRALLGNDINLSDDSVATQLIGVFAEPTDEVWQLGEDVYNSQYPDTANGVPLANAVSLVGIKPLAATPSVVILTLIGDIGALVPAGDIASIPSTGDRFVTLEAGIIAEGPQTHLYTVKQIEVGADYKATVNATTSNRVAALGESPADIVADLVIDINLTADPITATDNLDGTFSVVTDIIGTPFTTSFAVDIPQSSQISVASVSALTLYRTTVNGIDHDFNSDGDPTLPEIVTGVDASIDAGIQPVISTDQGNNTLDLRADTPTGVFTLAVSLNLIAADTTAVSGDLIENADVTIHTVDVLSESETAGPIQGPAGSITQIDTPEAGWNAVTNAFDAVLGRSEETDAAVRIRKEQSLQVAGFSVVEAIRAQLLQNVDNVNAVFVIENDGDVPDVDGRPPHSFEVIIDGGDDQEIADKIWAVKPAGIPPVSTDVTPVIKQVTDSMGFSHDIPFSRPTETDMYVRVTYSIHPEETFPADGELQIENGVLGYGVGLNIGADVVPSRISQSINAFVPVGIFDLLVEVSDDGIIFQADPFRIAFRSRAIFDSTRITIVNIPPSS